MNKPVIINITTRKQFLHFLKLLKKHIFKAVDTETNGLYPYAGNHIISLSVHFPEINETYNIAFFHGEGQVQIDWTKTYPEGTAFTDMKWQGKAKFQMYLSYWFEHFKAEKLANDPSYFGNLPVQWLEELKAAWGTGVYILHNSRFDAHVLYAAGFPDMETVYDTMIALHLVMEDWRHTKWKAPYTYTKKDAPQASMVGQWAKKPDGTLDIREQYGNRQLKWQAARMGIPFATDGETALFEAIKGFQEQLVNHIMENILDPINDSLLLAAVVKGKAKEEDWAKQREKIAAKVAIDNKANLWMLPSDSVAYYAGLDVVITWQMYEKLIVSMQSIDVIDLWEKQSLIHHKVAWEMERNGFKIDRSGAEAEIQMLQPRINELEDLLSRLAMEWGVEDFNPNSPKTLLAFLNSGVLGQEYHASIFPDWFNDQLKLGLKIYPNIKLYDRELEETGDELYGTDKRELEKVEDHAVVRMVKELRKMHKSVGTYLTKWLKAADSNDIVRFSINDDGTVAGRASSSGDAGNGQNIPDRGGYTIKSAIIPYNDEWVFWAADYGQLELRIGAWIGETLLGMDDELTMTRLFQSGEDMHSYVRDMINVREILFEGMDDVAIVVKIGYDLNNVKVNTEAKRAEVVSDYCRQVAKTMNFGLLYSGGARMLSKLLKIEEDPAKILVRRWRDLFPAFPKTQEYLTQLATTRRLVNDKWENEHPLNPDAVWKYPSLEVSYQDVYGKATAEDLNKLRIFRTRDGARAGMYVRQPISGRMRQFDYYETEATYFEEGQKRYFNPRQAAARKVWNNTDQGLGGFICMYSAYLISEELGYDNIKMFANIHDALEGFIHVSKLHLLPRIGEIMADWPITPGLTVDLQGSADGTWQGIKKITDMKKWAASEGKKGYDKK